MISEKQVTQTNERKVVLSSLWIFAMFNYLYADFFSMIFNATAIKDMAAEMTPGVVLAWAVFMETAMAMIFLSRVLKYRANRWANIIVGLLHTASVAWTLSGGVPQPFYLSYYLFFAVIEMACTLFIVWYAWRWKPPALAA